MAKLHLFRLNGDYTDDVGVADTNVGSNTEFVPGIFGQGAKSTANDGIIQYDAGADDVKFTTGPFTLRGWLYVAPNTTSGLLIGRWDFVNNQRSYMLQANFVSAGTVEIRTYLSADGVNSEFLSHATLTQGLYQLALTRSGNDYTLYVNGTPTPTQTATVVTGGYHIGTSPLHLIGYPGSSVSLVNSWIDDWEIWDEALDASVIEDDYWATFTSIYVANRNPSPGQSEVGRDHNVLLSIKDDEANVDLTNTIITVDGAVAYDNGEQAGFAVGVTSDGVGGYDFVINPDDDFDWGQSVDVRVQSQNDKATPEPIDDTKSFSVETDLVPPYLENLSPDHLTLGNDADVNVTFDVLDASSGVDIDTLVIDVDRGDGYQRAYDLGGGDQNGYVTTAVFNVDRYNVTINPGTDFTYDSMIKVRVSVDDIAGTSLIGYFWEFGVETDVVSPVLENLSPDNLATDVLINSNVYGEIYDAELAIDEQSIVIDIDRNDNFGFRRIYDYLGGAHKDYAVTISNLGSPITIKSYDDDLIAHYKMNDTNGGVIVEEASGRCVNGDYLLGTINSVTGKLDHAIEFNNNDYVYLTDSPSVFGHLTSFTIVVWLRADSAPDYDGIVSARHENENDYNSGNFVFHTRSGSFGFEANDLFLGSTFEAGVSIADGQWHMCAVVVHYANKAELWHGNTKVATKLGISPVTFNDQNRVQIGRRYYNSALQGAFDGGIDELRVYGRAMEQSDFDVLYNGGIGTDRGIANKDVYPRMSYLVNPTKDLYFDKDIQVKIQAEDVAGMPNVLNQTYSFHTVVPPFLRDKNPERFESIHPSANLLLTIDGGSGNIVQSTISIKLEGQVVYSASAFAAGFESSTIVADGGGNFSVIINGDDDLEVSTAYTIEVYAANDLGYTLDTSYDIRTMPVITIAPVTPLSGEKLVAQDTYISIDFPTQPTLVQVDGVTVYDGSFQNGWFGSLKTYDNAKRLVLDPPAPFAIGQVPSVRAETASENMTYAFEVGTTRVTTTDNTSSPRVTEADVYTWLGYIKEPGAVCLRKLDPLTSEVNVLPGHVVEVGYDPDLAKVVILYELNGKVMMILANPDDLPEGIGYPSVLNNKLQSPPMTTGEGKRFVPQENGHLALESWDETPSTHVLDAASASTVRIHVQSLVSSPEKDWVIGYIVVKRTTGITYLGFKEAGEDDYVEFVDTKPLESARYAALPVFRHPNNVAFNGRLGNYTSTPSNSDIVVAPGAAPGATVTPRKLDLIYYAPLKESPLEEFEITFQNVGEGVGYGINITTYLILSEYPEETVTIISHQAGDGHKQYMNISGFDQIGVG